MKVLLQFARLALVLAVFCGAPLLAQDQGNPSGRKLLSHPSPSYPALARQMNLTGTVKLEATVSISGTVKSIDVKGGNPLLAQSAASTVREWKWEKSDHESSEMVEIHFTP